MMKKMEAVLLASVGGPMIVLLATHTSSPMAKEAES